MARPGTGTEAVRFEERDALQVVPLLPVSCVIGDGEWVLMVDGGGGA